MLSCLLMFLGSLNSSCKILELNFRYNFFILNFSKMFRDESCRGDFPQSSPNGLLLVAQTDFVYKDEDFEIN